MLIPQKCVARKNKIITGLPDAYGRGRIIGDYRRIALYGIDYLMAQKKKDHDNTGYHTMSEEVIRLREEISEQYRALAQMKEMAAKYGYDISKPVKKRKRSCSMVILWLSSDNQISKWCDYVDRTYLCILRHLYPT